MKNKFPNLRIFIALAVITGGIYPLIMTMFGAIFFPHEAQGSLIKGENGKVIGSELIAQQTTAPRYFHPRPSAGDYATMPSGASNYGWTSAELKKVVEERRQNQLKMNNLPEGTPVPSDLLFASGSGLDPHIAVESAEFQIPRIVSVRNLPEDKVRELVKKNTIPGGILGETRVKVLPLNLDLDALK